MTDNNEYKITERPVEGDVYNGYLSHVEQFGVPEFLQAVDTVLDVEGVEALRWTQYTPYFNDGEPCEFGYQYGSVKLTFGEEDGGEYGNGWHSEYDLYEYSDERDENGRWILRYELNGHNTEAIYNALRSFETKAAHFENVLKVNFGDHAQVTATRDGFDVEYYEHE